MSYFCKTESPKVLAAVRAWDEKKAAWDAQPKKQGEAFGADASPMYNGSRNYVGGIKLSASRDLSCPQRRRLSTSAWSTYGKDCPDAIDREEMWEAIGI